MTAMTTDDRYDEILPERAHGVWNDEPLPDLGGHNAYVERVSPTARRWRYINPRAGDTIEVPCGECRGVGYHRDDSCGSCDGGGALRVLLTEDPAETTIPEPGDYRHRMGWRHVGEVQP